MYLLIEKEIYCRSCKSGKDFTTKLTLLKNLFSGTHNNPDRKCRLNREDIRTHSAVCAGYRTDRCVDIPSNGACLVTQMVKNLPVNVGDGSIPGSGRSPGEENGYPPQYSCLENSMDRGAWQVVVHGVANSWT